MKPPKCRLCGHEHWNGQPHVFDSTPARNHSVTKPATVVVTCNQCAVKDAEIERLKALLIEAVPAKPKRDRAAYMRKYRSTSFSVKF